MATTGNAGLDISQAEAQALREQFKALQPSERLIAIKLVRKGQSVEEATRAAKAAIADQERKIGKPNRTAAAKASAKKS